MKKEHQKHQPKLSFKDFLALFHRVHNEARPNQNLVMEDFPVEDKILLQAPTGTGKTALGYTFLKGNCGFAGNGFYVCPNKTLVDGVVQQYPEIMPMYGRNEYPCHYYNDEFKADEIPCSVLKECPHRVDLQTGKTYEDGAKPCPYLMAKFKSRQANIVACTTNYYFFEALSKSREGLPDAIVIDEVHEFSNSLRRMLSYKITDYRLDQFWELLCSIECRQEAKLIMTFKEAMIEVIKLHSAKKGKFASLLNDESLKTLLRILLKLERSNIDVKIKQAIKEGKINPKEDRELLRELDVFTNDLYRYIRSLEFALEGADKRPLSFVFGHWDKEIVPGKKTQYTLVIQSYRIAGLAKNKLLPEKYLACSATIGSDPQILMRDTGIGGKFIDLGSDFPIENTSIFMPSDVPNLSVKERSHNDLNRTIRRQILVGVRRGKKYGIRSLIIVVSELEREKCVKFAIEEGLDPISYGNGIKPKEAVQKFRSGEGDVLIGTEAQFGQGIDLPDNICGFIFYLRPGYPTPDNPQAQFEEKIYGNWCWALWTWRVILKMLQARGRNQRSANDLGCTFLMSQQFSRFTYAGLPEWLKPAYVGKVNFENAVTRGIKMLNKGN